MRSVQRYGLIVGFLVGLTLPLALPLALCRYTLAIITPYSGVTLPLALPCNPLPMQ